MMPRQCGYQNDAHNPFCDMTLGKNPDVGCGTSLPLPDVRFLVAPLGPGRHQHVRSSGMFRFAELPQEDH
jgi:hypothetical protein